MVDRRIVSGAAAGAVAAGIWALQEPLDMRVFGVDYSDAELLARPLGGSRRLGFVLHNVNGALFGAAYGALAPKLGGPGVATGMTAGMAEHLATWPLTRLLPGVDLWGNHRAFAQAVWRHLLFGAILGGLAEGYAGRTPA